MQTSSLKDLLQNKIDDMEKQVLSRVNTLEETKGASRNDSEQRNKVETTLTSLHHRITDLEKGEFAPRLSASRLRRIYFAAERSRIAARQRRFSFSLRRRREIAHSSCTQTLQGASGTAQFVRGSTIARACPLGG